MLKVALTGGIASGKSTVSDGFATLGVPVIDADLIARELTAPQTPLFDAIVSHLGTSIKRADNTLDRAALRERFLSDHAFADWLEALLHPPILQAIQDRLDQLNSPYCLIVLPLLAEVRTRYEATLRTMMDRCLVIDCPEDLQIQRAMARDHLPRETIEKFLRRQASHADRLAMADDIILNDGDLATLSAQIRALDKIYRNM